MITHHDAAPDNAVWQPTPTGDDPAAGELVGFIDRDLAQAALPVVDLAFVAFTRVPLTARDVAAADGFAADLDRAGRLGLLLSVYGWTGTVAEGVADAVDRAVTGVDSRPPSCLHPRRSPRLPG